MDQRNLRHLFAILAIAVTVESAVIVKSNSPTTTILTTRNVTEPKSFINLKIVDKPHHLFIGRCNPNHEILHAENIVLSNDGKSHVNATIRFNIEADVNITCVKVLDNVPDGEGGYPKFMDGGVGFNYVVIGVSTNYGKGFDFYVQIFGLPNEKHEEDDDIVRPSQYSGPYGNTNYL